MENFTSFKSENDCYHIFHYGNDDAPLFRDRADFERFLALLHIANNEIHFILRGTEAMKVFTVKHCSPLVNICAYCLLPDRYHIILSDHAANGTQRFIHKIDTAYVMYYNNKYKHRGTIFSGSYRAKRTPSKSLLYEFVSRVHLFPFSGKESLEPEDRGSESCAMKNAEGPAATKSDLRASTKRTMKRAINRASRYEYSSMKDYLGEDRPQKAILAR